MCNDEVTHKLKGMTVMQDVERYESLRHCKWVDEVIHDAPWVINEQFLLDHDVRPRTRAVCLSRSLRRSVLATLLSPSFSVGLDLIHRVSCRVRCHSRPCVAQIDFVCHDALPYVDTSGAATSGDCYADIKALGKFHETQRTEVCVSAPGVPPSAAISRCE